MDIGKINPESVPEVPTSPHPTSPGGGVTKPSQLEIAVQHEDMVSCWEPLHFDDAIDPPTKNHCNWGFHQPNCFVKRSGKLQAKIVKFHAEFFLLLVFFNTLTSKYEVCTYSCMHAC